ncbi:hypothetical protein JR316_0000279 [Psilocybe cubensis]|uniref:Uncharacterized protein n=2 Tax=Psilocybe cubensis TaxID=181762 RepID=A0A8H7Y6G8_PSICU|nr:hypothetical protein JR316_0000279 [Psilocybe cubensis]KAH9486215.1 hypothetical protein JR316_0000279 [Psilocybe cubensis]
MIQQPPPVQLPTLDAHDAAAAQSDPNHAYYWAYGDWAGGWTLDFGHYKGMPMNELPYYDYLLWTEENCHTERVSFQHALYQYTMGLQDQVNKCPGDFIIPFESQHCGKCIKDCGDAFLRFLVAKRKTPEEVQKYELFYLALQNYLNQLANQTIKNLGSSSRLNFGLLTPSSSQTQQDLQLSPRKQNAKGLQSPRNQRLTQRKRSVPTNRAQYQ